MIIFHLLIILLCIITIRLLFSYSVTAYSCFCVPDLHLAKYNSHSIGPLFHFFGWSFRFILLKRHFKTIFHSLLISNRILSIFMTFIRIHFVSILFIHILFNHISFFISIPFIPILFTSILFICILSIRMIFIFILLIRVSFIRIIFIRLFFHWYTFHCYTFYWCNFHSYYFHSHTVLLFYISIPLKKSNLSHKSIHLWGHELSNDLKILNTATSLTHNYKILVLKKFE